MPRAGGQVYPQVPRGVPAQAARYPQALPPRPLPVAGSAAQFAPPQQPAPAYLPAAPQPLPVATAASSLPIAVRAVDDKTFEADNFAGSQDDLSESLEITPPAVPTDAAALPPGKVAEEPGTLPQTPSADAVVTQEPEGLPDAEESPFSGLKLQTPDTPAAAPAEQAPSETIEIPAPKASASPQQEQLRLLKAAKEKTGFKGFCPVMVKTHRKLVPARPEFSTEYNSRPYSFSSAEAKATFDANPTDYAPAADGYDAVFLGDIEEKIEGSLDHAAWFKGHLFLFANPENQQIFMTDPEQYAKSLAELNTSPAAAPVKEPAETEPATLPASDTATPAQGDTPADAASPKADAATSDAATSDASNDDAFKIDAEDELEDPFGDLDEEEMPSLEATPPANAKVETTAPPAGPIPGKAPVIESKSPEAPLLDDEEEEADDLDDGFEFADEPAEGRKDTSEKPAAAAADKPQATTPAADDLPLLLEEDVGPVIVPTPKPVTATKPVPAAKMPVRPTRAPAAPPATLPTANHPLKAVPSRTGK